MYNFTLEKFTINDIKRIEEILELNLDYAGKYKNVTKMIQWSISNPDDLYRKVVDTNGVTIGYIGYDDASKKSNTKIFATNNDLYLEIYLHPDFTNRGLGPEIFKRSLEYLPINKKRIFGSTYKSNLRGQRFLVKLGMKYFCDGGYMGTFIYMMDI